MASNPQQGIPKQNKENPKPKPQKNDTNNQNNNQQTKASKNKKRNKKADNGKNDQPKAPEPVIIVKKPDEVQPSTSNNSNSKVDQVLKDVLNSLDCPVCLEFLKAPIFMCESGHDLCSACRGKLPLPICPICNMSVTNQRNYRLEAIVEKMSTPCTNQNHGCKFRGSDDDVKSHFDDCQFRQRFCPMGKEFKQCLWTGSVSELKKHFSEAHPRNMILKPGNQVMFDNFDLNKPDQDIQLISVGKSLYLYHVRIDPYNKLALWGIQSLGVRKYDINATYEFQIFNSKKNCKKIVINEACQPESLCFDDIYNSGECVAIPLHVLKTYLHDNKKFTFNFVIKKGIDPKYAKKNPSIAAPKAIEDDISLLKLKI